MDLPMRIKSDPAEEEDIKIVLVKPAKSSLAASVPSAVQLHRNGVRQGGLDLFSVSRKPTPERETSMPLPPSIPPTPPPIQPTAIQPATPAFDPTAFFNALTVWMQQQAKQQAQQQLQQGLQIQPVAAPSAIAAPAVPAAREPQREVAIDHSRGETTGEFVEERENQGGDDEMQGNEENEEPSIDEELMKLLEGSSEEKKMQLLEFIKSGKGDDNKNLQAKKGRKNERKEEGRNEERRRTKKKKEEEEEDDEEYTDKDFWLAKNDQRTCPRCREYVGPVRNTRIVHYQRYHYDAYFSGISTFMSEAERFVGTNLGMKENENSRRELRACLHCSSASLYKGRKGLIDHMREEHHEKLEALKRRYKSRIEENRRFSDKEVHKILMAPQSATRGRGRPSSRK